jgi:hypothetical protein
MAHESSELAQLRAEMAALREENERLRALSTTTECVNPYVPRMFVLTRPISPDLRVRFHTRRLARMLIKLTGLSGRG